jgi:protein disulfide-isomerase A1
MKTVFGAFCLLAAVALGAVEVDDAGVLVLTDATFDEAVAQNDALLVEFYAPWCGHCKSLAPEYDKAAKALSDAGSAAKLSKIDATAHKESAEKHAIKGFPTLKFFKKGHVSEYNGGRTGPEIVNWLNKKSGPAAKTISNVDDLESMQEANDVVVLGTFASMESAGAKGFMALADADDMLTYAISTDAAVASSLGVTGDNVIVLKSFDDKRADHAAATWDGSAAAEFIAGNSVPLVQTFSQEAAKGIFASPIKNHILFFTDKTKEHHAPTIETVTEIAKEYKGKTLFINVPATEKRVLDYFGFSEDKLPQLVLAEMGDDAMKKFPFTEELTGAGIRGFIKDFFDGKLAPTLKSEEPAADDLTTDVVTLRGKTFADIVLNNEKDVLVEFYAPWCGHCKKLAPIFDEVGERLKSNENIVIAKMDATANEVNVPGLAVKGYPTLYFFKGNDKSHPVKYEGGREADDFVAYLKENAHNTVTHDEL